MQNERSGCTAIATVISPSHIVVANAGDSRSAMQVGSETVALSEDHKPYNAEEKNRIEVSVELLACVCACIRAFVYVMCAHACACVRVCTSVGVLCARG